MVDNLSTVRCRSTVVVVARASTDTILIYKNVNSRRLAICYLLYADSGARLVFEDKTLAGDGMLVDTSSGVAYFTISSLWMGRQFMRC